MRERGYLCIAEHAEQHFDPPLTAIAKRLRVRLDMILDGLERARDGAR